MGIINDLKNRFNKESEKQNQSLRVEIKEVEMFYPQFRSAAKHNYGKEITQIFTAKIKINSDSYGEATILNDGDIPICIEIPENIKLEDILTDKMLEFLNDNGYFEGMSREHYNMLGRITIQEGMPKISKISEKMIESIKTLKLDEELKKEREQLAKKLQDQRALWQQKDYEINANTVKRIEKNKKNSECER